jgi:hypothetical protein
VPWVDQSVPPYSPPSPKPVRHPASAPPCHAAQLRAQPGRSGTATGNESQEVVFINTSATTCLLKGSPGLSAVRGGTRVTLLARPHDTFFGQVDPANLKPGGFSLLRLHMSTGCNKPAQRLTALRIRLPVGDVIGVPRVSIGDACGLAVSDFGLPRRYEREVARPGTPSVLKATLDVPSSVKSGTTLEYTVTLTNPTGRTVTMRPCPGYTQGVFAQGYATSLSYRLNCQTVRTIAPNGKATYAMQLDLPPTKSDVDTKLAWGLNMPVGPYAARTLKVTAG